MPLPSAARRPGAVSLAALLAIPVLLLLIGLVVYVAFLRESRGEVQNGADAAALAAAQALASDDFLRSGSAHATARLDAARAAARELAGANRSQGDKLHIKDNADNDPNGDLVFGVLDRPFGTFRPFDPKETDGDRANAVRVVVGRQPLRSPFGGRSSDRDVRARATALLDRHVVGFRPVDEGTAPLMPVGLCFGREGVPVGEWEPAWRGGKDEWRFDATTGEFKPGEDGIAEYEVVIGDGKADALGAFLRFGPAEPDDVLRQIGTGVTRDDLAKWGGELSLAVHNKLTVSSSAECPPPSHSLHAALADALRAAREPRAWPLFAEVDVESGTVRVLGWTGARVVSVTATDTGFRLRLQPAVVCHPSVTAVPDPKLAPAFWAGNRTVFALRLAE